MWEQEPLIPLTLFHSKPLPCGWGTCERPAVWVHTSEYTAQLMHLDGIRAHSWEPKVYKRKWYQIWEPRERNNMRWFTREWIPPYG